jgi:signal transduction histidine kinase
VLFNLSIDKIFKQYAINQQNKTIKEIVTQINQQYNDQTGLYNIDGIEIIANSALQNGIMVHLKTINNEIDWDIRQHKNQECLIILQHTEKIMHNRYPNFQGGFTEDTFDLFNNGKLVGLLTVGYYGPYSLDESEMSLISQLNRALILIGLNLLVITVFISVRISNKITSPITRVIETSQKIANGKYGILIKESSRTRETNNLIQAINKMSQALQNIDQQKKQITADVAHELRTPLFNLQGNMEAMIDNVLEPTPERLQTCHAELLRLNHIVEQLQDLNLLEDSQTTLSIDSFDFSDLFISIASDFEMLIKIRGIKLLSSIPVPAPICGDRYRLKQCLVNLISNAINHSKAGETVTVEYEMLPKGSSIRVYDNGTGIPQEDIPHIFERFYRVDKSRSHKNESGMGLGLAITKAIVDAHGGTISVDSLVGSGTVFTINLPQVRKS